MCGCGWPIVVCRDPENNGWFELSDKVVICNVQAVIDREKRERQSNENYEPDPGEILSVVYTKDADPADPS